MYANRDRDAAPSRAWPSGTPRRRREEGSRAPCTGRGLVVIGHERQRANSILEKENGAYHCCSRTPLPGGHRGRECGRSVGREHTEEQEAERRRSGRRAQTAEHTDVLIQQWIQQPVRAQREFERKDESDQIGDRGNRGRHKQQADERQEQRQDARKQVPLVTATYIEPSRTFVGVATR